MDRDHLRFGLKWAAIALSVVVVTWVANAPIASRWERTGTSGAAAAVPEVAPAEAERLRRELFDGLVTAFAAEGLEAWWRLREDETVAFGYRIPGGPCACRIELVFPDGGLAPWSRLAGADERWIPWWPCAGARRTAMVWLERIEAARRQVLEREGGPG